MKQIRLIILLTFFTTKLIGQTCYDGFAYFTFDNSPSNCLFTDNLSNPNNIWQIGSPNKTIFTSSFSSPKAIVTDLSNPYPINDTSIFIVKFLAEAYGFQNQHTASIEGKYYVNSDTLTDFGKIEFSPNNGTTWIDLLNDTVLLDTANL